MVGSVDLREYQNNRHNEDKEERLRRTIKRARVGSRHRLKWNKYHAMLQEENQTKQDRLGQALHHPKADKRANYDITRAV